MHPFEFDLEPFDGWDVNHVLNDATLNGGGAENPALTRVVWGVERPEMLITETMANHDRATEDRDDEFDSTLEPDRRHTPNHPSRGQDQSLDSRFVPRTSAFIELYNPWFTAPQVNNFNHSYPAELYGAGGIDLARMAGASPVWQIVITGIGGPRLATSPNGTTKAPSGLLPGAYLDDTDDPRFGRLVERDVLRRVYFAEPTAGGVEFTGNKVYFPAPTIDVGELPPGQHAILGSSGIVDGDQHHSYLGTRMDGDLSQTRRITLDPTNLSVEQVFFDAGTRRITSSTTLASNVIPIGMQTAGPRSLSATDPTDGYGSLVPPGVSIATDADGFEFLTEVIDEPLDTRHPELLWGLLRSDSIHRRLRRFVHLRRLANPLVPHDQVLNPYLTIDSMAMPVNSFNGVAGVSDIEEMNQIGEQVVDENGKRIRTLTPQAVTSQERSSNSLYARNATGGIMFSAGNRAIDSERLRMFWQSGQMGLEQQAEVLYFSEDFESADGHFHSFNFRNSFGELDVAYRLAGDRQFLQTTPSTSGFPALTWNNRPFISHLELANVPYTSSYRLLHQFSVKDNSGKHNVFRAAGRPSGTRYGCSGTFPHLLGFNADRDANETAPGNASSPGESNKATNLCRVMDYLEVPSRYIGTETFLNPNDFNSSGQASGLGLNAPFNKVSNYRYPGKININTIFDERVWRGLLRDNGLPGNYAQVIPYSTLAATRRGSNQQAALAGMGPSEFLDPFRSARSSNLVPEQNLVVSSAETGLFRRPLTGGSSALSPLFDYDELNPNLMGVPVTSHDPFRSAIDRYDLRQRLGNLVTTRSSVFSIWITIGFFEVDLENSTDVSSPFPGDIVFGEEVGSDTGEVERYRGFYMVDRSIPVGFEPGVNHNVDEAILASSITERSETD